MQNIYMKFVITIVMMSIFLTSCRSDPNIHEVVELLKSDVSTNQDYLVNPLDFIETEVNIPGSTFEFEKGNRDSLEDAVDSLNPEETFEKVSSLDFLNRVATISEIIEPTLKEKIQVNKEYKDNYVNIYFLPERLAPKALKEACAYVGYGGVILCDGDSLAKIIKNILRKDDFLGISLFDRISKRALRKDELAQETLNTVHAYIAGGFLSWVLAHELGHYVNDYDDVEKRKYIAHFKVKNLLAEKEIRADEFAANSLKNSRLGSIIAGYSFNEFMAVELSELAPTSKTLTVEQINILSQGILPDNFNLELEDTGISRLLIRAASIASILNQSENFGDGGFSQQIHDSVKISPSFGIISLIELSPYLIIFCISALGVYFVVTNSNLRRR